MFRNLSILFFALVLLTSPSALSAEESISQEPLINKQIREKLSRGVRIEGEELKTGPLLKIFYEGQEYESLWSKNDKLKKQAKELIDYINKVEEEGLDPASYHAKSLDSIINPEGGEKSEFNENTLADLDLLLTDAFFAMAYHFSHGFLNPYNMNIRWYSLDMSEQLREAVTEAVNKKRIEKTLDNFLPQDKNYKALKKYLSEYKEMLPTVEWPKIPKLPPKKKIKVGDQDERILIVRERLGVTKKKGLNEDTLEAKTHDEELEQAVIEFQKRNGLLEDGVIGWRTIDAMNVPINKRIEQIKINMDRHRAWSYIMKDQDKRVVVNIPAFYLNAYQNNERVLGMKIIVGMYKRQTPLLSSKIRYLIFSPKWFMPDTILFEDKLPKIIKDPSYLSRHGMKVYEKGGGQVDAESIDWAAITSKNDIPYRVVQASGNLNALGKVKFIFPNRHDVYLHDTPGKYLFERATRTFSSGCMRIAKPVELAKLLLNDKSDWDEEKIEAAMNQGYEQKAPLTEPVPVHITYVTAFVDEEGQLQFRNDVYGFDRVYERALRK